MTVQLFMQATVLLGRYYGYDTLAYEDVKERSEKAGFSALPFMPPETLPATPKFRKETLNAWAPTRDTDRDSRITTYQGKIKDAWSYNGLVKYYITTGMRASQVICRNYLYNLEERNSYVQFLQDQYGAFNNIAGLVLSASNANGTLRDAFSFAKTGVDGMLDKYQDYRFLNVNYEEARLLIETAQNQLADHFYRQVDGSVTESGNPQTYKRLFTFSDALNAVSIIEAQCTRSGIRKLISKAVYATPTNMMVDPRTGMLVFQSDVEAGKRAEAVAKAGDDSHRTGESKGQPGVATVGANPTVAPAPAPAPAPQGARAPAGAGG